MYRQIKGFIQGLLLTAAGLPLALLATAVAREQFAVTPQATSDALLGSAPVVQAPPPMSDGPTGWFDKPSAGEAVVELPPSHSFGESASLRDLRVFSILLPGAPDQTDLLTLDEALEAGVCRVVETGNVNELVAEVSGNQPVLALTGDLLLGGRQDRIVAHSVVLEPGMNSVQVFCVEHGRWQARSDEDGAEFRKERTRPQVDISVKGAAAVEASQSRVWSTVEQTNQSLRAEDALSTGSYRNAFRTTGAFEVDPLVAGARHLVTADVVGFAVFRGGEFVTADIFDSKALLQKVAEKLLRSYAMSAVLGTSAVNSGEELSHEVNEDPSDLPNRDLAENPNDVDRSEESPTPNNASLGMYGSGGSGPVGARRPPEPMQLIEKTTETGLVRRECARSGTTKPVHISLFGRR